MRASSPIRAPASTAASTSTNSSVLTISRTARAAVSRPRVAVTVSRRRSGKRRPASAPTVVPAITVAMLVMVPTNMAGC